MNTHFDFDPFVQNRSAELIIGFLSELQETCPVIITGDFNTRPGSDAYTIFMDNGFNEVFGKDHTFTFHGFTGKGETGDHIDWILHRGKLNVKGRRVVRDCFDGRFPSDHFPVVAEFQSS